MHNNIRKLVTLLKDQRKISLGKVKKAFESIVRLSRNSKPSERSLQAYLYLNFEQLFSECKELLLFERPLIDRKSTQFGKLDFLFLTHDNKLMIIETKIIETERTGKTERTKRTMKRRKIEEQILRAKDQLVWFGIPEILILCSLLGTDDYFTDKSILIENHEINAKFIPYEELKEWIKQKNKDNIIENQVQNELLAFSLARGWP